MMVFLGPGMFIYKIVLKQGFANEYHRVHMNTTNQIT